METRLHRLLFGRRRIADAKRKKKARVHRRQFGRRAMAEANRKKKAIFFPEELVEQILIRLPVKSLLRFKCVCKAWYNRISAEDFTFLHLNTYKPSDVLVAGITSSSENIFLLTTVSAPTRGYAEAATIVNHELPQKKVGERVRKIFTMSCGPCNGIFCLYSGIYDILLWNPSIHDFKIIPRPNLPPLSQRSAIVYTVGFGFDPKTNDFKILLHILFDTRDHQGHDHQLHLYSLGTNSWKNLDASTLNNSNIHCGSPWFTTNSKIGWLDRRLYQIYLFDLSSETLDMIPIYLEGSTICSRGETGDIFSRKLFVFPLGESIAVLIARVPGYCDYFEIWELDDYSFAYPRCWRKLWTIQLKIPRILEPLGLWGSSYLILRDMKDQTLVLYDVDMKDWNLVLSDLLNLDVVDPGGGGVGKGLMDDFALYKESLIYIGDRKR